MAAERTEHRNQHTVQAAHLRRFANSWGKLWQYDKQTRLVRDVAVSDATGQPDFYTMHTENGEESLFWEKEILAERIENFGERSISGFLAEPSAVLSDEDRERIAAWIAMSALRTTRLRSHMARNAAPEWLHLQSWKSGSPIPRSTIERQVEGNPDIGKNFHLMGVAATFTLMATEICQRRSWGIVRFDGPRLLTSDNPVANYHEDDEVKFRGFDQPLFAVALSPRIGVLISGRGTSDYHLPAEDAVADMFNHKTIQSAERYVYHSASDASDRFFPKLSAEERRKLFQELQRRTKHQEVSATPGS